MNRAVPFHRHKLYAIHRPLTALWRAGEPPQSSAQHDLMGTRSDELSVLAGELASRCSILVLYGCATGWAVRFAVGFPLCFDSFAALFWLKV